MQLSSINFGDVDAKNEILKQSRTGERTFFDSFSLPRLVNLDDFLNGTRYFVLGLKGTGKTALLRYLFDKTQSAGHAGSFVLFKSEVSEEDRTSLSRGSGFEILKTNDATIFIQDFKEAWKWMIYQRIANTLFHAWAKNDELSKLYKLTSIVENEPSKSLGSLFSKIKSGGLKVSAEALGVAFEFGIEVENSGETKAASLSSLNRICSGLLDRASPQEPVYLFFDELELFHQTPEQFDRDRRIIRDLIYAIAQINAESAEARRRIFVISSLRTEVLHSVLELGHEIGRDVDDYGVRLDWSDGRVAADHPLLSLVGKKIAASSGITEDRVWQAFFPSKINGKPYFEFILNTSYFRPRDLVRLFRVARDYDPTASQFTDRHFDETSTEFSKQTWLEVTEELLAAYSPKEINAIQRLFLGFKTHFFISDLADRVANRYRNDSDIQGLFGKKGVSGVLEDLYRIGVLGNDFVAVDGRGRKTGRNRWIFRGNTTLNDAERMAFHKSLWKHLSLVSGKD